MLEADALTLQLDQALQVVGSAGKTAGHLAGEIADIMVLPPRNERRALPEDAFPAEQPADVCGDMERELAALETRLTFFQSLRELQLHPPDVFAAPKPANAEVVVTPSPPRPHSQSSQQQQAGQVADEVESALRTCDQLLHRARSIGKCSLAYFRRPHRQSFPSLTHAIRLVDTSNCGSISSCHTRKRVEQKCVGRERVVEKENCLRPPR